MLYNKQIYIRHKLKFWFNIKIQSESELIVDSFFFFLVAPVACRRAQARELSHTNYTTTYLTYEATRELQ